MWRCLAVIGGASIHQLIFVILWLVVCGYALARGGSPERWAAMLFLSGAILSRWCEKSAAAPFRDVETGMFLVDGMMFAGLIIVALRSARFWPMPMATLQGAQLLVHVGRYFALGIAPSAYFLAEILWSFPMLSLLAAATWRHRGRLERFGFD